MMTNRMVIGLIVALVMASPYMHAGQNRIVLPINNIEYNIYGVSHAEAEKQVVPFHEIFEQESFRIFERFNVKRPWRFAVHIAFGAWIFKDLTGYGSETAGLYSCFHNSFYFQRPRALSEKGLLYKTISHEMIHCVIASERRDSGIDPCENKESWLDEAFCLSVSSEHRPAVNNRDVKKIKSLSREQFAAYMKKNIQGVDKKKRALAYKWAHVWGDYLLKNLGEKEFFHLTVTRSGSITLKRLYQQFQKNLER